MMTLDQLLALAQYALAAALAMKQGRLPDNAAGLLGAWTLANDCLRQSLGEFNASMPATATRRAFGSLLAEQPAQLSAAAECFALLKDSDALRNQFADGDWEGVSDVLTRNVLHAYHQALEFHGRTR